MFPELVDSEVIVTNSRGLHADSMAEHALGLLLAFARKLHLARDAQRDRRWTDIEQWTSAPPFKDLAGSTLGIVGLGSIGTGLPAEQRGQEATHYTNRFPGTPEFLGLHPSIEDLRHP